VARPQVLTDVRVAHRTRIASLGAAVLDAVATSDDPPEQLRAAIHAYFDIVIERGVLLANLSGPGSEIRRGTSVDLALHLIGTD